MKSKLVAEGKTRFYYKNRVKNKISFDLKVNKINKYFLTILGNMMIRKNCSQRKNKICNQI